MIFGLPWFAIVAIVAIAGGLLYAYKEKEMELEEKRMGSARELTEMRKMQHNLKSRIENLEAIITEERKQSASPADSDINPLSDIEIEDEVENQNTDNIGSKRKTRA